MKRSVNNNSGSPSKRFKTNKEDDNTETLPDPFQPFLRKKATAILEHGIDASGFIQGQIRLKWPIIGGKTRVFLEVKENGHVLRFEVAFSGKCIDYFKSVGLQFSIGDEIQLSLRGASLEKLSTSRDNAIPMILKYSAGVVMRFTSSHSEGPGRTLIDTWEGAPFTVFKFYR